MGYYSVTKRNKLLSHVKTWMNLKCTLLREELVRKRYILCDSIFMIFWKRQIYIDGEILSVSRGLGGNER